MDFSTEFVAFRDRMIAGQDKTFVTEMNVQVADAQRQRSAALDWTGSASCWDWFRWAAKAMRHEYRLLFAAPELDGQSLQEWWQYAEAVERELVKPDRSHEFSLVSVILVTGKLDPAVPKKLRKLAAGRDFTNIGQDGLPCGWRWLICPPIRSIRTAWVTL